MFQPEDCTDIQSPAMPAVLDRNEFDQFQCPYPVDRSEPAYMYNTTPQRPRPNEYMYHTTPPRPRPNAYCQIGDGQQMPMSSHSAKVNIPKFCGYTHDDPSRFLEKFNSYCMLSGINRNDDPRKVAAFHLHMAGPALSWFNCLPDESKANWAVLQQAFVGYYIPNENSLDAGMLVESAAFDALFLHPMQQIEDFYSAVLDKGRKLRKHDRDIISKFVNGLPHQLAFFVRAGKAQTLQDVLQSAKIGEAYGYRTQRPVISPTMNMNLPVNAISTTTEGRITDQLAEISKRLDHLEMGRGRPATRQPRSPATRSERECFRCGAPGHFERQCNWSGEGSKRPDLQCQICNQKGHAARRCKLITENSYPAQENSQGLEANLHGTSRATN